ncbi:glycoside hydrolase superfamily [Jimgerdemannia flammicorona]|uniref:Glycoside hydrolase superfamily n=1 Tax=Jimgerdemannia flammicorona TaxID=994334 RepID=A0A433Q6F8_9FUNG|nr:glycoside hydrolase superfamily [Jimgerdemannia flammicorona]
MVKAFSIISAVCALGLSVLVNAVPFEKRGGSFNPQCNNNVVLYWGQDSAANGNLPLQGRLKEYCDGNSDIIVLAFMTNFHDSTGNPALNFANQCEPSSAFPGTNLLHCPAIGADIKYCQSQGKIVLLSLGGWTSETTAPDANSFADLLWNLFGEGSSKTRPFDDALIDGFDWDIEHAPGVDISAVANRLATHYKSGKKKYYTTIAPFCSGLSTQSYNADFLKNVYVDFIWPQFYNDWCSNAYYGKQAAPGQYYMNYVDWHKWATGGGNPNKNVKLYVGGLAGDHAGNPNDFLGVSATTNQLSSLQKDFPETFGGAMYWDASYAYGQTPNYAGLAKSAMAGGASCKAGRPPKVTNTETATKTSTKTKTHKRKTKTATATDIGTPTSTTADVGGPTPTPTTGSCSQSGQAICSQPGKADGYSQCVNGNWIPRACGPGTVCVQNDSSSISCGFTDGIRSNFQLPIEAGPEKIAKNPLEENPNFPPLQTFRPM